MLAKIALALSACALFSTLCVPITATNERTETHLDSIFCREIIVKDKYGNVTIVLSGDLGILTIREIGSDTRLSLDSNSVTVSKDTEILAYLAGLKEGFGSLSLMDETENQVLTGEGIKAFHGVLAILAEEN